jgi:hypothetical protein
MPQELGGSVELAFASSGVCCKIEIPLRAGAIERGLDIQIA